MNVKDEKTVSWAEAKRLIAEKENKKDFAYEQKNALDHLRKFCRLPDKKYEKIVEELKGMEKLKERHIAAILNFLPETQNELRVLFANDRLVLTEEDKRKILKTVKSVK
jgi:DNA-directed RNA polymerase subunit F